VLYWSGDRMSRAAASPFRGVRWVWVSEQLGKEDFKDVDEL
jgi:hypothetical protein